MVTDIGFDALLFVSFGGPEHPQDVVPFLENVTRGRGIARERLEEVGEHYFRFGGRSPINDQNRALILAIEKDLVEEGLDLPVYWGNRNWDPYLRDTLAAMTAAGVRNAAVFITSAYSSYSGCRQYRENLADALCAAGEGAPRLAKVRHYFNHPGFITPMIHNTRTALAQLPASAREGARLVFVTHSIPIAMNEGSGPTGGAYVAQHRDAAAAIVAGLGTGLGTGLAAGTGRARAWDLAFCSRSGPPTQQWLEPDINDHLAALAAEGVPGVVIVPIGFVSDHMEVAFDLDVEALATADRLGLPATRAATVGTAPEFVAAVRELVLERAAAEAGENPARPYVGELGASHDLCPVGCCPNPRGERPAACGSDSGR